MSGSVVNCGKKIWRRVTRKKHVDVENTETLLRRCLSTKRLTFIGLGRTVGVGIYVLIGVATKDYAGPAVILAFVVAFVVTLFNALCFAEYAAKNPKTGAQYTYMYETVGEGVAFIVGWSNVVAYTASLSLAARGWSGYLDSLFNHAIQNYTIAHVGNWSRDQPFTEYPDLPAVSVVILVMIVLSLGVNFSATVNTILAFVSGILLIFISCVGLFYADISNWQNDHGGFFPKGVGGVLKASSVCFYAFQGFEIIGFTSEEAENPKKSVPKAIVCELLIVLLLYLSVSISFTLMTPYWTVNIRAPFHGAIEAHSVTWAKYIVAIGPILALTNLCALEFYCLSRITYSMASDGLLLKVFSNVNRCTKVPLTPLFVFGPIVICVVLILDLQNIIGFMVLLSFIQFSFFAAYMIVLRYEGQHVNEGLNSDLPMAAFGDRGKIPETPLNNGEDIHSPIDQDHIKDHINIRNIQRNRYSDMLFRNYVLRSLQTIAVKYCVIVLYIALFLLALLLLNCQMPFHWMTASSLMVLGTLCVITTIIIGCHEQRGDNRGFLVPLMPVLPILCIFFNMVLLVSVSTAGAIVASSILVGVGGIIYSIMVLYDVIKNPDRNDKCRDPTYLEESNLLTSDYGEIDFETTN